MSIFTQDIMGANQFRKKKRNNLARTRCLRKAKETKKGIHINKTMNKKRKSKDKIGKKKSRRVPCHYWLFGHCLNIICEYFLKLFLTV